MYWTRREFDSYNGRKESRITLIIESMDDAEEVAKRYLLSFEDGDKKDVVRCLFNSGKCAHIDKCDIWKGYSMLSRISFDQDDGIVEGERLEVGPLYVEVA